MPEKDAEVPAAQTPGRLDELFLPEAQHLPAREPRIDHPAADGQDENHVSEAWAEDAGDGDGEENERKGELDVGDPHRDVIKSAGEVAGEQAEAHADRERQEHREEADEQ